MNQTKTGSPDHRKTEQCLLCGRDTGIPFHEPIDGRKHYIDGCGQLCADCYRKLVLTHREE